MPHIVEALECFREGDGSVRNVFTTLAYSSKILRIGLHHLKSLPPETINIRQVRTEGNFGAFIVVGWRRPPLKEFQIIGLANNEVWFLLSICELNNSTQKEGLEENNGSDNPHGSQALSLSWFGGSVKL